jgi:tetratricopeptide (TPR) repeat protein
MRQPATRIPVGAPATTISPSSARRRTLFALGLVTVWGCASAGMAAPGRRDIPALEARLRQDSAAASVRVRLAVAYRDSGDVRRAIALLEPVTRADPTDDAAALWLGLSYEEAERYAEARAQYESFLQHSRSSSLRSRVQSRLELIAALEIRAAARASLAREQELASTPPSPRTVGVFPFLFAGTDTTYRPLGRALSELLTTDLSQTDRLRVLERAQLQVIADEMRLTRQGYVDPATAARAGRIVSAEHIVQGRIAGGPTDLSMQALVVRTESAAEASGGTIREEGGVSRLFDMEKAIALAVYSRVGIQLTAAERERVERRLTSNVQALIAFGYGLEARDAGNYAEAARQFTRATQFDPGFRRAREMRDDASRLSIAAAGTRDLAGIAGTAIDLSLTRWQREQLTIGLLESTIPNPQVRDPIVEVLGTEGVGRGVGIDIVIRRPGGSE